MHVGVFVGVRAGLASRQLISRVCLCRHFLLVVPRCVPEMLGSPKRQERSVSCVLAVGPGRNFVRLMCVSGRQDILLLECPSGSSILVPIARGNVERCSPGRPHLHMCIRAESPTFRVSPRGLHPRVLRRLSSLRWAWAFTPIWVAVWAVSNK